MAKLSSTGFFVLLSMMVIGTIIYLRLWTVEADLDPIDTRIDRLSFKVFYETAAKNFLSRHYTYCKQQQTCSTIESRKSTLYGVTQGRRDLCLSCLFFVTRVGQRAKAAKTKSQSSEKPGQKAKAAKTKSQSSKKPKQQKQTLQHSP